MFKVAILPIYVASTAHAINGLRLILEDFNFIHASDGPVGQFVCLYPAGLEGLAVKKYYDEFIAILLYARGETGSCRRRHTSLDTIHSLGPEELLSVFPMIGPRVADLVLHFRHLVILSTYYLPKFWVLHGYAGQFGYIKRCRTVAPVDKPMRRVKEGTFELKLECKTVHLF